MKLFTRERLRTSGVVIVLTGILLALATLQYRWSGDISDAAVVRMRSNLSASGVAFREELRRDLMSVTSGLSPNGDLASQQELISYAKQVTLWRRVNRRSAMVVNLCVWRPSKHTAELLCLDAAAGQFVRVSWPSRFEPIRKVLDSVQPIFRLIALRRSVAGSPPEGIFRRWEQPRPVPWAFAEDIPVLLHPLLTVRASPNGRAADWLIVELSATALKEQVLPEIVAKYFGSPAASSFDVTIMQNPAGRVVYSSGSKSNRDGRNADMTFSLFGVPPPPPEANLIRTGPPDERSGNQLRSTENGLFRWNVAEKGPGLAPPNILLPFSPMSDWELVVRHRDGSLESAVAALRHKNLIVSFAILLVLAATMAVMVVAGHRARRLARLQMEFVAGVSHELRTPLAVISSATDNLSDGIVGDRQQVTLYGKAIKSQTRQLILLVDQILMFAGTRNNRYHYNLQVLEVPAVVQSALDASCELIQSSGIKLESSTEPALPLVRGDLAALTQTLQNLVTNAVKYGESGGWIGISAHLGEDEGVEISVADRGLGIHQAELQKIFEPFYRCPSVVGAQIRGTGLGLSLAKSIAEAMGGKITVVSELGEGSVFTLHLPAWYGLDDSSNEYQHSFARASAKLATHTVDSSVCSPNPSSGGY